MPNSSQSYDELKSYMRRIFSWDEVVEKSFCFACRFSTGYFGRPVFFSFSLHFRIWEGFKKSHKTLKTLFDRILIWNDRSHFIILWMCFKRNLIHKIWLAVTFRRPFLMGKSYWATFKIWPVYTRPLRIFILAGQI